MDSSISGIPNREVVCRMVWVNYSFMREPGQGYDGLRKDGFGVTPLLLTRFTRPPGQLKLLSSLRFGWHFFPLKQEVY